MERLTNKKEADAQRKTYKRRLEQGYPRNIPEERFLKLAEYEDAEEDGRLVSLPCKVGDMVYDRKAEPWKVFSVQWYSKKVTQLHCVSPASGIRCTFSVGKRSLGKTVFLTQEEAEASLRGVADGT